MTRALCLSALLVALAACGAANASHDDHTVSPSDRSTPPARSSADETDGPTAPRGSAARPIGEGAGYDEHDDE